MTYKNLRKKTEGFTIIEVLIVLAIAGLIMLIVFLAVPALQRNQRNNARNTEASRISAAAGECLANRNGQVGSCLTNAALNITPGTDTQQLTAVAYANGGSTAPASGTAGAGVWFGRTCDAAGAASTASTNTREFVVLFTLEGSGAPTRCISS